MSAVPLLEASGLTKSFSSGTNLLGSPSGHVPAVQGVDLRVDRGETVALVGESGAGKSTVGRLVLRLLEPDDGSITFDGIDLRALSRRQLRAHRKRMQMIFQDPFSSLDPRMSIVDAVGEALTVHFGTKGVDRRRRALELLDRVGVSASQANRRPHELSGGQLQRTAIARALAVEPELVVCDEPLAALDVSIQAQVVNLLADLQQERHVSYIFVTHDLSLVRVIADRVAVMFQGRIVEEATPQELFGRPLHPYTRALLDVIPVPDPRRERRARRPPAQSQRTSAGCAYAPHCPDAIDACWSAVPTLVPTGTGGGVSCHVAAPRARGIERPADQPEGVT